MEITEFCISGFTAHARAVRSLRVWYLWRMPEMDAPRALVFRPLVKGNDALGTRLLIAKIALLSELSRNASVPEVGKLCKIQRDGFARLFGSLVKVVFPIRMRKPITMERTLSLSTTLTFVTTFGWFSKPFSQSISPKLYMHVHARARTWVGTWFL